MLLTNWLRSISNRCRAPRTRKTAQQRRMRYLSAASLSHALSTRESIAQTEVLEDRTLLTSTFKVTSDNYIDEGDSGTSIYIFTVTRTRDYQSNLNSVAWVDFNTIDGTALAGSDDYIPVSTRLIFEASSTAYSQTQTVEVQIKGDSLVEKNEYFKGVLSNNSSGTTITTNREYSYANITNDDQAVVSINDVTVNESAGTAELTISVAGTFESSFDVSYSTSNGTATSNKDYTQTGGIFSFEPGDVSKTVTVDLIDDDLFELDEQFDVNLNALYVNGYNIVLGNSYGTVTIQPDDDFVPQYEMHSKFFVPDSAADTDPESDAFGRTLAVDGDTLIVSSPAWDGAGNNLGAVFIYIRNNQGTPTDYSDDTWDYQATLLPPAGSLTSGFGNAVAISGDTAVIANQFDTQGASHSGAVYVYTRTNNTWTYRQTIKASDYEAGDFFGAAVAIDNDTIVVGSPNSRGEKIYNATGSDLNQGAVYVYTRSGNTWMEKAKLTASDLQQGRQLGNAVDIQGTTILAGAANDHEVAYASGAAYLFELQDDEWTEIDKLKASAIQQDANFGYSVSLDGDNLVIGTPNHTFPKPTNGNPQRAGVAFVFSRENQVWHQTQMLTFSQVIFNTGFGRAVEIKGDRILVGSINKYVYPTSYENGPVYLFRKINSTWVLNDALMDDSLPDGARFGERIALADHSVLVGAYADPEQADWAGSVYIFNETDRPLITVGDVTITEGDTGSKYATIVVTRTGTSPGDLSIPALVNFTTRDAEAKTATGDYAAASGTLVFDGDPNAVSQTRTFTVQIFGDTFVEKNETFLIELSDIIGDARLLEKTSTVTIREDDQSLVRIDDVSVHENEGTATIFVSLDKPVDATVSVDYTTANRTAYSTADYVSTSGTITFIAGTQSQAITIPIVNNSQVEAEESFYVNLSHIQSEGANVAFSDSQGEVSIQDDDQTVIPLLSINDVTVNEDAGTATLNVSLSAAIPTTVTVDYFTANNTAVSPNNYLARSGTVSFNPLETAKTITIPIFDSGLVEDDKTFFVFLNNIQSGVYQVLMNDDLALVTILEKTRPRLTISDLSVNEGAGTATLSVKLSRALTEAVSIEYATADDSAHSTTDFESSTGIVTFAVGETTQTIEIPLTNDGLVEADESFLVNLFNLQDGSLDVGILDNQARVTIRDNDQATISIDDITVNEDAGTAVLQVSLSAPVDGDVFVDFATADQTATSPDAYVETTGTLQFHAGEQMKTITIPIVNTTPLEAYQSFLVNLSHVQSNGMIVTIADNQAKVTIIDSFPLRLSIDNVTVDEAGGTATLYVSLNQAIDSPFSVDFHTDSHTALPTSDYTDTSGTIVFASQQTTKVITIPLVNDDVIEPDEIFLVSLENIQSSDYLIEFGDDQAFVKIEDDDTPPLKISDDSDFVLQQRLSADPAYANHSQDYFGRIVAIDGDTMVVGVPEILLTSTSIYPDSGPGAVYVYTRNQNGTATDKTDDTWDFQTALTPDPFQENHFSFGSSIAVYGDTIVVGAKHESSGTVYIFTRSGNNWTSQPPQVATVTIPGLYSNAQVGGAVAIYEDTIVVGAVNGSNGGIAYILEKQGETWAAPKRSEIKPSDLHSLDYFGNAVAIHGDLIVVGAKYAGPNGYWSGAAYVVTKNGADWSTLSPTIAKLLPRNGTMFGEFGSKVATNGVEVAISSAKKDSSSYAIGSVHIFTRNGTNWSTLAPTEVKFYSGIQYDEFGSDLALTADRLIVGTTGDSKTYIYHKTTSSWYSATLDQVISHGVGSNTEFGFGVAASGSTIVIGAPGDDSVSSNSGSIITYEKTGSNNWAQSDELLPGENQPSHNGGDLFGNHIAIDGDYMVVSAAGTDSSLAPDGIVYLYSRNDQGTPDVDSDDTWDFVRSLLPPDPSAVTGFGLGVAIDDGTILIGARLTSGNYEVYIYERNGADWTLLPPKISPLLSKYNYKNSDGFTLAVSGDTIVIGQPKATGNFSTSGVISVYAKRGSDWSTLSPVETVLYADDGSYGDKFGQSIDIDGDRIIVGAPEKGDTGAVYLFEKGSTNWRTTATQHRLTINEPLIYELLGKAVSIEGDLVAVAAKYDDVSTPNGVVYLLDGSAGWDQPVQTTFSASETNLTLYYGDHIDLSGQTLVVSNGSTESRAGLYIYDGSSGWDSLNGTKLSLNPDAREYRSFFASEFAVSGNNIVSYASTGSPRAIGEVYVINRRPLPEISIEDASIVEGDAGTQSLQLTVTLTGNNLDLIPGNNVSFAYATANGTATTAGNDYQSQTGTLTFDTSSGASSYTKTILINITGDTNPESDEYFYVSLSAPSVPVLIRKHQAKVTIENDDQINLSIDDLTVHSDAQTANVTVSLNQEIDVPVSIEFTTVDQTAINGVDYQTTTGTLTFNPGETSKTISVPVFNSSQIEASKKFLINLSNLQSTSSLVVLTDSQAEVTIVDANQPTFSINDKTVDEDAGTATITVTLNQALTSAVTVDYATADDSANSGSDYQSKTGTLTFNPGDTTQTIQITLTDSDITELDETFLVNLANPQSDAFQPTLADSQAVVTIKDNDPGLLSINDITVDEDAGTALLTVSLDHAASKAISVDYATANDSASSGSDYQSKSGTLTFNPGETTQTIEITLVDSGLVEVDETFLVNLSNLQAAGLDVSLPDTQGVVTIQDDDQASLSIQDLTVDEDAGTVSLTVSLDRALQTGITVDFSTLDGTALADSDYSTTSGTLTFDPGETAQTITLTILNDTIPESAESFFVNLSNLQSGGLDVVVPDNQAEVTITSSDQPTFSIDDLIVNEAAGTATVTVTLSQVLTSAISVDFTTADDSASSGSDYQSKTGTLTFNPGDTTQFIQITIDDADITEPDETFLINLTNPQSGVYQPTLADSQAVVTIQDNDPGLLSINDITVDEDTGTALLTVSLDHAASRAISVDYATADGTASSGSDYQSSTGTLTFNPGDTTQTIEITLVDSTLVEADETFLVNLLNLQAAGLDISITDSQGEVTIHDDDRASLSVQDLTVDEDAGTVLLTVSLDQPLLTNITVDFSTLDGTALVDSDYTATSGTLTFAAGETTQTISLTIQDDALQESAESFFVKLSSLDQNGSPVDLASDQAEITIRDNDQAKLTINDIEVNEDIGTATLTVSLDKALTTAFTVDYQTGDDTAVVDSDYLLSSGTLMFDPGEVTKTIYVSIVDSDNVELTETLHIQLTNLQAADYLVSLSDSIGEISILDNDQATLSIDDIIVNEDDGTAQLTVSLDQVVEGLVQVDFVTADQTAIAGTDFQQTNGTLNFNTGETTKTITVNLVDDDLLETDETFLINLLNLQSQGLSVSLADSQAEVTIHDDDQATLSIDDLTVNEDAGTVTLTVSLDHPVPGAITVDFETLNGTALSTADYTATSGTLTFNPGQTTQTITLEILNDDLNEAAESFFVNLTNLQANGYQVNLVDAQSEITIISDEYASLSINNVTVSEDSGMATLTVSLDQPLDTSVSVNFATANSTANSVYHYESTSGTITFNPGEQSQTISIPIIDSDWVERDRFFYVNLSEIQVTGSRVDFAESQGRVTILEDDQAVFSVDDVIVDEDVGYATVTISLSASVKTDINLYFNTTDQTAVESQDYVNRFGVMLVPFNERIHTYRIPIIDTDQVENDETFFFNLTGISANGLNVVLGDAQGQVTIRDDDQANLTVHNLSVNEAAGKALVTVTLDHSVDGQVSVDYSTIDQSATASSDYLAKSGTLTFTPGMMQQTIEIDLVDGAPVELPETFDLQLSNLQAGGLNVVISDDRATVTIKDDDLGDYEFKNKLHAEGIAHPSDIFGYDNAVDGDTLISGSPGWDHIQNGPEGAFLSYGGAFIYVRNDQGTPDYSGDDTWDYQSTLFASDADNFSDNYGWSVDISGDTAVVGAPQGDGTIDNIGSAYVYTRSNGIWTFQQELNASDAEFNSYFGGIVAIEGDTIVVGARVENNNTGSAYVFTRENGVWTETAKLMADDAAEEMFFANTLDIENSTIVVGALFESETYQKSGAVYVFTEQDGVWTQSQKLKDSTPGPYGRFGSSVSLEGDLLLIGAPSYLNYSQSAGKAILYQRDPDNGLWSPLQNLVASDATLNSFFGNYVEIHNEQIFVSASSDPTGVEANGAVYRFEQVNQVWVEQQKFSSPDADPSDLYGISFVAANDMLLISARYDDDLAPNTGSIYVYGLPQNPIITIDDVSITEADDGSRLITANVTRTATKPGELIFGATVDFHTIDGTATIADGDYESTTGTITFESDPDASTQTQTISIRIYGDSLLENDETFGIELLNVTGHAQIPDPDATVTIQNDDQTALRIDDVSVDEDAGFATVTVSLTQPLGTSVSVDFATADQTADSATDYASVNGTLTFDPGVQSQTIDISITDSDLVEFDETFFLNLFNLQTTNSNVILGDSLAQVTILDDDQATLSINDVTVNEDAGTATLMVSLDQLVDTAISVDFTTADLSATQSDDFTTTSGTLIINPGELSQTITISISDSNLVELDETFLVNLSGLQTNGRDVAIADNQAQVTILDNDQATVSIADTFIDEDAGTGTITVSLSQPVDTSITVNYTTTDQTALNSEDYTGLSGTLTFNIGEQSKTIIVSLLDDNLIELDETFLVELSVLQNNGRNVVLGDNQAVVTIQDDDQAAISINDISVSEDVGTATVTVSLDLPVTETISVHYALNDLTALSSSDYTDTSGTLTFMPGEQTKTISISITDSDIFENDEIFQVQLSQLQANGLNVVLKDDLGEVTIVDEASGSAEIQLRVVDTPTITELSGESDTLPTHLNHVSEWETYWVEFWIDTSVPANQGVFSAGLDFHYETAFTSATEIEYGTGFNSNQTGTIDDQAGTVSGIYAETSSDHLGESRFLLFARLKFEPLATDQVVVDLDGKSIGPYQLGFEISSQQVSLSGDVPVYTSVASFSQTDIWANPFDFNDDDKINYRDLIFLVGVYNKIPSESDLQNAWIADLNQDNKVNYRDLILLVGNYGKNKADNRTVNYPANYPDVWNQHLLVNTLTEAQPDPVTVTQSAAENTLTSIVDQIQPQLDPVQQNSLAQVNIQVVDLQGDALGHVLSNTIYIDSNAAGYGWFIDTTPFDHSEFVYSSELTLIALEDGPAANQIDLWTVIMHELGHILGADHATEGVMQKTLDPGIRKLPGFLDNLNEVPLQSEMEIDDFFSDMTEDIDLIVL